jgi:hypothetical protein
MAGPIWLKLFFDVHNVQRQYTNHEWLAEKANLAAKNLDVNKSNFKI